MVTMKAVGYRESGPIDRDDALIDFKTEKPEPSGRDLLVQVKAISVNPVNYKVRMRCAPEGELVILGYDAVGEVAAVGDEVWYAGAIDRPGTNAKFHLVDERIVGREPQSVSNAEAAALPLTTLTAYEMLFDRLRVNDPIPARPIRCSSSAGPAALDRSRSSFCRL
jgi:NADPH:quinone reductase-like Zn-dependent oxidoreductase